MNYKSHQRKDELQNIMNEIWFVLYNNFLWRKSNQEHGVLIYKFRCHVLVRHFWGGILDSAEEKNNKKYI